MSVDDRYRLFFCVGCGEMLGVEDHMHIRHEHLDTGVHPGYRIVDVSPFWFDREELSLIRDALNGWEDSRRQIARRRDRKEGGSHVECALGEFFTKCRATRSKVVQMMGAQRP